MEFEKKNRKEVHIAGIIAALMILALLTFVMFKIFSGVTEPVVTVADGNIKIDVKFGVTFPVSEVTKVTLLEQSMDEIGVGERTNGYGGFDTTRLGHFHSDALGDYLLYARTDAKPMLWIDRAGDAEDVYLSYADGAKTQAVFEQLAGVVPKG